LSSAGDTSFPVGSEACVGRRMRRCLLLTSEHESALVLVRMAQMTPLVQSINGILARFVIRMGSYA